MVQESLTLPLRRSKRPAGKATNLYIPPALKKSGALAARDRYGWSLSELVRALLSREVEHKRGIIHARMIGGKP